MEELCATAGTRLAPLDLRQEERLSQDMVGGGQQRRQAADILHCGVKIEQGVAPITATRDRPFVGRQVASLKRGAEWFDPTRWDCAAEQEEAFVV